MASIKEVFEDIRKFYKEDIPNRVKEFAPIALSIFSFNSPVYTSQTRNSWSYKDSKEDGKYIIEFGNTASQALYSEYGTLSMFSPNSVNINGHTIYSETSKSKDIRTNTGMTAKEAIFAWCEYKGISDENIKYAIYKKIMSLGRNKNPPIAGMCTAIPFVYDEYIQVVGEMFK